MSIATLFLSVLLINSTQASPDSSKISIDTLTIEKGKSFSVRFSNSAGIDSLKWPIDFSKFSCTVNFFEAAGLIKEQNLEGKTITTYMYALSPNFYGKYLLPSAEVWSAGQMQILSIADSIEVVPSKIPIFFDDLLSTKKRQKSHKIDIQFDCVPSRVCTKAWFINPNFHKGDTVVLVVAINKARASIKIPEIKGMTYLTHSAISNASFTNGEVKEYKYVASSFVLLKDMKRIKTKTLRIKYGSSTYYVPKVKLKNPWFK